MHALKSCKKSTRNSFIPFIQIQPLLIFCSIYLSVTLLLFIFMFIFFLFSHKPLVSWRSYSPLLKMVQSVIPKNKDILLCNHGMLIKVRKLTTVIKLLFNPQSLFHFCQLSQ